MAFSLVRCKLSAVGCRRRSPLDAQSATTSRPLPYLNGRVAGVTTEPVFVFEWGTKQVDLSIEDLKTPRDLFQHLSRRRVMNLDTAVCQAISDHGASLREVAA